MSRSAIWQPILWLLLATVIIIADQVSKAIAERVLQEAGNAIYVTSWFNWRLAYNPGAAWSFMANMGGSQRWILATLSAVVSLSLMIWILRLANTDKLLSGALALVLGGAVGNLIDRVETGLVVDFIQWHYADYYWPTFNIADVAICIGAALLILHSFISPEPSNTPKA